MSQTNTCEISRANKEVCLTAFIKWIWSWCLTYNCVSFAIVAHIRSTFTFINVFKKSYNNILTYVNSFDKSMNHHQKI